MHGAGYSQGALSEDALLGGAVTIVQPREGFRASTDAVLLAAACRAEPGARVLDVGCGVGAAALCLAYRRPGLALEGLDIQEPLIELSRRNAARNGLGGWLAHCADIRDAPLFVRSTSYDHVLTNPPYYAAESGPASPSTGRDVAHRETAALGDWLDFCLRRLKPRGALTVIQRIERLPEMLAALEGRAGAIRALPLSPRRGAAAKRVVVTAVKESRTPFTLVAPLELHRGVEGEDAAPFTPEAQAILRDGAPLV
ncbi:MAG: methyltransferase, partial [Pseudomonadota bacterium]